METAPLSAIELDALRAYVPTETLLQINAISKAECAECDKANRELDAANKAIADAKERMRRDRALIKQMEAKRKAHFARPLFPRSDAARTAAIEAAKVARAAAIAAGEAPKFETLAECTKRVEGVK